MKKYIIYCRKSSTDDEKQTQSIPDQIKYCIEYYKSHQDEMELMERPKDFSDFLTEKDKLDIANSEPYEKAIYESVKDYFVVFESKTAKTPGVRPKWRKLIKMVEKWQIEWILSYSPDRQARNILEWWELINLVDEDRVFLRYTNFHFENTASGKMMLGVWFVFAKQYSDGISENVNRWNKETLERGKGLGHKKHGYQRNEEWYYQPDDTWELVYEAFQKKLHENTTNKKIARWMNDNGYRYKYGDRTLKMDDQKVGDMVKDTFYYWLLIAWKNQSDQLVDNPYFKPCISEDEFEVIKAKWIKAQWWQPYQQSKDENEQCYLLPDQFIFWEHGNLLSPGIPNKWRYKKKLKELQKTKPGKILADIIKPHQITYNVGNKKSEDYGTSIKGNEITTIIRDALSKISIQADTYETYVNDMRDHIKRANHRRWVILKEHTKSINHRNNKLTDFIANKGHLKGGDEKEREVYKQWRKEIEDTINTITNERNKLEKRGKETALELDVFIGILNNADDYYERASYVQKAEITKIFFSNIIVNKKNEYNLAVKPIFESLFSNWMSSGAGDETRTRNQQLGRLWL